MNNITTKIIVLLLILFSSKIFGQNKKIFFDKKWKETIDSVGAEYYRIVNKTKDGLNHNIYNVEDFYKNDAIQMQGTFQDEDLKVKNGLFVWFYKNGNKQTVALYNGNKKNGELQKFYENGALKRVEIYKDDSIISGKCFTISGQDTCYFPWDSNAKFRKTKEFNAFRDFVNSKVKYPEELAKDGIEGRVEIQFCINTLGEQCDISVLESPHPLFTKAAIKAVTSHEKWEPAIKEGRKVKQKFTIPITFKLQK